MKIALILCPSWTVESPSYTLALLSANLKKHGHQTRCFDLNIEMYRSCKDQKEIDTWQMDEKGAVWYEENHALDFIKRHDKSIEKEIKEILRFNPDIIGFTVYSTSRYFSYEFARRIKEKDSKRIIIFGGPQCFRNCEGIDILKQPHIDAVCLGEGDIALPKMLDIIAKNKGAIGRCAGFGIRDKTGNIMDCGDEKLLDDLNILPYADYSDFDINKYTKKLLPIATSRGCLGRCKFCNESPHWKRYRFRTTENICNEIRYQLDKHPEIKEFWFNDSLINGNIKMLDELCSLFIESKLEIKYGGQALIRPEMNSSLLTKMKQSGCAIISYGLESGSNAVLREMRKIYTTETAEKVIRDTYNSGIEVIFNIIIGFPREGEKELGETKAFIQANLNYAKEISIMPLLLLKGSYLYEHSEQFDIDPETKEDQLNWKTLDNKNNYAGRMQGFKLLKDIVGKRSYTTYSEGEKDQDLEENLSLPNICIELSSNCNMKCYMCVHSYEHSVHGDSCRNGFMKLDIFENILECMRKDARIMESVTLYWLGESLIHPEFKKILSKLLKMNMEKKIFSNLFINTNGTHFDSEVSNIILEYASYIQNKKGYENCYLNIHFSIESLDPVSYEKIKGVNCSFLNIALKNIDFLLKERHKRRLLLPSLTFGAVVLEDNAEKLEDFDSYWKNNLKQYDRMCVTIFETEYFRDKDAVYFRKLDDPAGYYSGKPEKMYHNLVARFKKQASDNIVQDLKEKASGSRKPCFQLWNMYMISTDGIVTPCCKDRFLELQIGDLNRTNLSEILYGDKIKKIRLDHLHNKFYKYKICAECKDPPGGFLNNEEIINYMKQENIKDAYDLGENIIPKKKNKKLAICLVSREYPPETGWGGIGTYTYHLAHGLADRGHKVHVISQSLDGDIDYMDGMVNVHRVKHREVFLHKWPFVEFALRLEYSRSVYLKLKDIIKSCSIDIVEAPNLSGEAFIYSLSKKTPLVTRLHTHFSEAMNFYGIPRSIDIRLSCFLEDAAIKKSDLVICSTQAHAALVAEEVGIKSENIKIIPLGIPLPLKNESRSEGCKKPIVLFVGRLEKRKGPHILAKAIPLVLKEMPDTDFIFIGRDTFVSKDCISISGEDKHSFKSMVLNMIPEPCLKNVKFLGYVEQEKLPYYFNLCDIFVAPSLYESFGLIYIEAMSYGKPVIGCGVGGVPEVIKDNKTGILVPPDDHVSLANAIVDLLNNQKKRMGIGLAARKDAEASFSRELMVERTEKAYASLLI